MQNPGHNTNVFGYFFRLLPLRLPLAAHPLSRQFSLTDVTNTIKVSAVTGQFRRSEICPSSATPKHTKLTQTQPNHRGTAAERNHHEMVEATPRNNPVCRGISHPIEICKRTLQNEVQFNPHMCAQ